MRFFTDWEALAKDSPYFDERHKWTSIAGLALVIHLCFANSCAGRREAPILKYDASGKLLAQWGAGMFVFPHGATVDGEGNLRVTDARRAMLLSSIQKLQTTAQLMQTRRQRDDLSRQIRSAAVQKNRCRPYAPEQKNRVRSVGVLRQELPFC